MKAEGEAAAVRAMFRAIKQNKFTASGCHATAAAVPAYYIAAIADSTVIAFTAPELINYDVLYDGKDNATIDSDGLDLHKSSL